MSLVFDLLDQELPSIAPVHASWEYAKVNVVEF